MDRLKKYVKERNKAMFSLDEKKIKAFCRKWGVPIPENENVFWAGVHKVILHTTASTDAQKAHSLLWLVMHGFSPNIE